ncbi:MAG: sugar ABC transporter permease [Bacilli bacterium]|jgi:ABC-type sugar transport system permease subunit
MKLKKFFEKINIYKKFKKLPFKKQKKIVAYIFLLPWLVGLIVFFLPPLIDTLYSSFFSYNIDRNTGMKWAGFQNFRTFFNPNETILTSAINSLVEVLYTIPVALIFSLFIALILNSKFKGRGIVRTIFFLPLIFGLKVIHVVMANNPTLALLDNEVSTSGSVMGVLSVSSVVQFLYDSGLPRGFLDAIISPINRIFSIITFTGVQILLFLAALQSIDKKLYEVAAIEGCNKYESFWKITLPMVFPTMKIVVVYTIIDTISRSEIVSYLSSNAMSRYAPGVASATSFLIILTSLVLIALSVLLIPKGGGER